MANTSKKAGAFELADHIEALQDELKDADRDQLVRKDAQRYKIRSRIIDSDPSDKMGQERLIGRSDLVSINYLSRGLKASRAVCKIRVPSITGEWSGTGFLVAPGLLLTNNHVLQSKADAEQAEAEFGFELDEEGVKGKPIKFNLAPSQFFLTNKALDFTFVAVTPRSEHSVPLSRFGFLPLMPASGKALHGEWVTIIQHANGLSKQISVRSNQVVDVSLESKLGKPGPKIRKIGQNFIHYSTDTDRGASGAPVLGDQWQVVALHHKAIPDTASFAKLKRKEIDVADPSFRWVANQGVRISAIYDFLHANRFSLEGVANLLERLAKATGFPEIRAMPVVRQQEVTLEKEGKPRATSYWQEQDSLGFNDSFLSEELPLQTIIAPIINSLADRFDGQGKTLDYLHFSSVINKQRKFSAMVAVNIRGADLKHPGGSKTWRRDIRMHEDFQPGDNFYAAKLGNDPVRFDRGHLVRRLDPCWGSLREAKLANDHTYHFSNAVPQINYYNGNIWGDLEDYVLNQAQTKDKDMSVFTGPVFRDDDPKYGESREGGWWRIPVSHWKIAVVQKPNKRVAAVGFLLAQTQYLKPLLETMPFKLNPYTLSEIMSNEFQVPISKIMELTGLDFSMLLEHDSFDALEGASEIRRITSLSDIVV